LPKKDRGVGEREGEREGDRERERGRELTIKIPSKLPGRDQLVVLLFLTQDSKIFIHNQTWM
jgi:hypothetical protein